LYTQVFEQANALDKLESFTSKFGPEFYNLPYNQDKIKLVKKPWKINENIPFGDEMLIPFMANESLSWQVELGATNNGH
jgi:dihydroorotase